MLPAMVAMAAVVAYPLVRVIWLSFRSATLFSIGPATSENYRVLFQDSTFWEALRNTAVWTGSTTVAEAALGLVAALIANATFPGRDAVRGAILFPYMLPKVIVAMVWMFMFNDIFGVANHLLLAAGLIQEPVSWFSRPETAMAGVAIVGIWKFFPFCFISILAGLQTIPQELYEAARVDGASKWREFTSITLPSIAPVVVMVLLVRAIWNYNEFDLIYLITKGGPLGSTTTLPLLSYQQAYSYYDIGTAAATGVLMLLMLGSFAAVMVLFYQWVERRFQ
ncbi:carbohydrate ABC transporter permease [Geochorda subterranea]|uniref:Sugar ABC transporter permease n=1 Tax=Geochorda subterranea TaxID=3109564 RepID=A0ABZ1BPJ8_9FIRM|nr:sugar ABC transporter permease [Limnochorda sp. LNt]WRP14520.1 sugar ABC transporter permease [Limnochorda sp. LNt]